MNDIPRHNHGMAKRCDEECPQYQVLHLVKDTDGYGCTAGDPCTTDEKCPAHGGRHPVTMTEQVTAPEQVYDQMTGPEQQAFREGNLGEVIDERVRVYGDPVQTFVRIAQVWSGIAGFEIQPTSVPLMMAGMKMVRAEVAPDYADNSDDIEGYLDIFRKLVGEDMIEARSVKEYIDARKQRGDW